MSPRPPRQLRRPGIASAANRHRLSALPSLQATRSPELASGHGEQIEARLTQQRAALITVAYALRAEQEDFTLAEPPSPTPPARQRNRNAEAAQPAGEAASSATSPSARKNAEAEGHEIWKPRHRDASAAATEQTRPPSPPAEADQVDEVDRDRRRQAASKLEAQSRRGAGYADRRPPCRGHRPGRRSGRGNCWADGRPTRAAEQIDGLGNAEWQLRCWWSS